jgi:hypothetical protein
MTSAITIAGRFCGPPGSGNGGYSAGLLAELVDRSGDMCAEVTLRSPPPLDHPLRIETGRVIRAFDGDTVVLEAVAKQLALDVPAPPSWPDAQHLSLGYVGFDEHIFPRCFTCGPERDEGDGLRIFAGRRSPDGPLAAPWRPSNSVAADGIVQSAVVWAALDCPGYFAVARAGELAVLGRMHAKLDEPLRADERYIVTAWPIGREGRKLSAGTAVFRAADGHCVGRALQTWITLPTR